MKIEKLSTGPFRAVKKPERKVGKGKGKETRPGSCKNPPRPRACEATGVTAARLDVFAGPADVARASLSRRQADLAMSHQRKDLGNSVTPSATVGRLTASINISAGRIAPLGKRTSPSRYRVAGAAADELIDILGGNKGNDRGTWGYYCYHHDIETILEKAREIASRHRQGELKWPIRAFQRWLQCSSGRVGQ